MDVAIVGAGFTGLWTAHYLARQDPTLRVVVLESEVAGFGASGRNGGWCSALFPASWRRMGRDTSPQDVLAMQGALQDAVDEVGRSKIACDYAKGGSVALARNPAQLRRAEAHVAEARTWGIDADALALLGAAQARDRIGASDVLGAVTTPHCAALHPAKLVRGLACSVEAAGVRVYEGTRALSVQPHRVVTTHGTVTADVVLPATEGYTARLPGHRRDLVPVYSLMLATEPLPDELWQQLRLHDRATFSDKRHLVVYGQRTADGRIAFGGRGAPYHFGSRVESGYDLVPRVHEALEQALVELLPAVRGARITHRWGGCLGVPRDWYPSVGYDRTSGMAWAGGYVGDGVAASCLAGQTVADLVLGRDTARTHLPWVRRRTRSWEPEPLRWVGVNGVTRLMTRADASEARTGRPSRSAAAFWRAVGQ